MASMCVIDSDYILVLFGPDMHFYLFFFEQMIVEGNYFFIKCICWGSAV